MFFIYLKVAHDALLDANKYCNNSTKYYMQKKKNKGVYYF
jgi:hypothetical protein